MSTGLIRNAHVISPKCDLPNAAILIEGTRIARVAAADEPLAADWTYDAKGAYVVPGFIDIHTHGAAGMDITDETDGAVVAVAKAKLEEGCTSFAPTTLTLAEETLAASLTAIADYAKTARYSKVIGTHLEGPYINPACLGAQNPAFVRKPDVEEVRRLQAITPISQITFAVEVEGGDAFAQACLDNGIVPSCGHSKATYAQFKRAYHRGLRHLTHFCNQMTPLHHRDIGLVGAGLLHGDVRTEIICDKIHLAPEMIQLIFARRPIETIVMITDSMRASHLPDGPSSLGGLEVIVKDGQARLASNGALAGSVLQMNIALKNVHEVTGKPLAEIIQATSWNQAVELGRGDELGKVEAGYLADLAVLDPATFAVQAVFVDGGQRI
ncbi:MAG: N-acetylglucosamine-6-phosphate deacetylase [Kiritimatiellae bacterium]|nr:N-acetylglucosamine-6-phosphate deacetylase [Kiritimatiellia bacterium]